jgi:hypothetical protein
MHVIGLEPIDYAKMSVEEASLIWSPRTNITLNGNTAQVFV